MITKHKHWTFLAYDEMSDDGNYVEPAEVTINDEQFESNALIEVKRIIKRKHYVLRKVWECVTCPATMRQVENTRQMAEEMKKQNND